MHCIYNGIIWMCIGYVYINICYIFLHNIYIYILYVCVWVLLCVYFIHMHTCFLLVYVYIYIFTYTCMYVFVFIHLYIYMCIWRQGDIVYTLKSSKHDILYIWSLLLMSLLFLDCCFAYVYWLFFINCYHDYYLFLVLGR